MYICPRKGCCQSVHRTDHILYFLYSRTTVSQVTIFTTLHGRVHNRSVQGTHLEIRAMEKSWFGIPTSEIQPADITLISAVTGNSQLRLVWCISQMACTIVEIDLALAANDNEM